MSSDFPTLCKAFAASFGRGGRQKAADVLGVPKPTFDKWCDGSRAPRDTRVVLLTMAAIAAGLEPFGASAESDAPAEEFRTIGSVE